MRVFENLKKMCKRYLGQDKTEEKSLDFSMLMTGQLVALYKKSEDEIYREEYLRRLVYLGFSSEESECMFNYECRIVKEKSMERLCKPDYMFSSEFNLIIPEFSQEEEYYIENQMFLCSEITKIWDEAEWHMVWSHETIKSEPVWSEIFRISKHGGADLFIGYMEAMSNLSGVLLEKIRKYSQAEQKMLFKYKWDTRSNRSHPYGEMAVSEENKEANEVQGNDLDTGKLFIRSEYGKVRYQIESTIIIDQFYDTPKEFVAFLRNGGLYDFYDGFMKYYKVQNPYKKEQFHVSEIQTSDGYSIICAELPKPEYALLCYRMYFVCDASFTQNALYTIEKEFTGGALFLWSKTSRRKMQNITSPEWSAENRNQRRVAEIESIAKLYYAEKVGGRRDYLKYSFEDIQTAERKEEGNKLGIHRVQKDVSLGKQRMIFSLDAGRVWFLSVFFYDDGTFDMFSLDEEDVKEAHYEFRDEQKVRSLLYKEGDENKYLHEVFREYIKESSGYKLLAAIGPAITASFPYD